MSIRSRLLPVLLVLPFFAGCTGLDVLEPVEDTTRFHILDTGLDPEAAETLDPEGRAVAIARPPAAFKDFNDLLQAEMTP